MEWILSCDMSFVVFLLKKLFKFKGGLGPLERGVFFERAKVVVWFSINLTISKEQDDRQLRGGVFL